MKKAWKKLAVSLLAAVLFFGATGIGEIPAKAAALQEASRAEAVYRLYDSRTGEHYYTTGYPECITLVNAGWTFEGVAWYGSQYDMSTPVYFLYNRNTGEHHYTTNKTEYDNLIALFPGWESAGYGIGWYAGGSTPVYRLNNPNEYKPGGRLPAAHHFTTDVNERDFLVSIGWQDEGIAWYAYAPGELESTANANWTASTWGKSIKGLQHNGSYSYTDDADQWFTNIIIGESSDPFYWYSNHSGAYKRYKISANFLADAGYNTGDRNTYNTVVDEYVYNGKTYYFNKMWANDQIKAIKSHNDRGQKVHVAFLIKYDDSTSYLIDGSSRTQGHLFYMPTSTGEGGETLKAFYSYFAQRLKDSGARIDNWILGNEVNTQIYCYEGSGDTATKATKYAKCFQAMSDAVRAVDSSARCSICFDHCWNLTAAPDQVRPVRDFLATFANVVGKDAEWYISFHMYPAAVDNSIMWRSDSAALKSLDTQVFDATNLSIITDYIRDTYGAKHRIMLTEQGFEKNKHGVQNQAAALAYSYYAAYYNDMVDSLLINLETNANEDFSFSNEAKQVWDYLGDGNADHKKWIDDYCLPIIGASSWSTLVPNYRG